jgi:hypothetical protein
VTGGDISIELQQEFHREVLRRCRIIITFERKVLQ